MCEYGNECRLLYMYCRWIFINLMPVKNCATMKYMLFYPISFIGIKQFFGAGLRAIGNVQKATARQGFLGGVVSSGAWVVPVSAGAMIGRFNNEITAIVKELGMLLYR